MNLAAYTRACTYPGLLDDAQVEAALQQYLAALGVKREVRRLRRGWSLETEPALQRMVDAVLRDARDALDALAALDARDARDALAARAARDALAALAARAARDARDARDALDARDARDALAALAALAARDARDALAALAARDAIAARDARDALDARDARERFARWCVWRTGWWTWDMSYLASTYLGAAQTRADKVQQWSEPLMRAFLAGAWMLCWTEETLYWIAKPSLRYLAETRRLHCETGPAMACDIEDLYYWRGTLVPGEWITDRASLAPQTALTWPNIEQRRAACEILGWANILAALPNKIIDADLDQMVGTLIEVDLPDSGQEKFLRVLCGTGREFALPVPPQMRTALEAQAWTWHLSTKDFSKPEIRT